MKIYRYICVIAATGTFGLNALAGNKTPCDVLERRILAATSSFTNLDKRNASINKNATSPATVFRNVKQKAEVQQDIADRIWDARAEMMNNNCQNAASFTF